MTIAADLIDLGLKPEQRFIYEGSMVICPYFLHRVLLGSCIDYSSIGQRATVNAPPQKTFTGNVRNFVKVLFKQRDRDDQLIDYKVVKLPKNKYGANLRALLIPRDYVAPDTKPRANRWREAMEQFEKFFQSYVERSVMRNSIA